MKQKDAFYLLFVHDYGVGPLFKSQIDLVNDLLNTPESAYFIDKTQKEEYTKAVSRIKAYISQLFSEGSKRTITAEFKRSLEILLKKKRISQNFDYDQVLETILTDLKEKNLGYRHSTINTKKDIDNYSDFFKNILDGRYISVFSAREIALELNLANRRFSVVDFLIDDFISSLKSDSTVKKYRFNFPLEQSCTLFWRGLKKEIVKYLYINKQSLAFLIPLLHSRKAIELDRVESNKNDLLYEDVEKKIAPALLNYLSKNNIINVFHLKVPIYITSSIAVNPNDPLSCSTYLFLQSTSGEDQIHKLSEQEVLLWRFFVWNNLKINNQGKLIEPTNS